MRTLAVGGGPFHLGLTLESGQIFHAMAVGEWRQVLAGHELLELRQDARGTLFLRRGSARRARSFLALDHHLGAIFASFPQDPYTQAAVKACAGMRILRQPRWECLATFITSPMKQVAHIRAISLTLRARFGSPVPGSLVNAYPEPAVMAALTEADLRACGLGFRAKGLLATARQVASGGVDLDALAALPTPALRDALCRLPGIGRKVANCIVLFAYERLDAVPVDVWIARIASALRKGRKRATPLELERFATRRFGPHAGYVQQYLFHHARTTGTLPHQ